MHDVPHPVAHPACSPEAAAFALPAHMLYLDCAAQGPRLRDVLAAGHAALDAGTTSQALSFDAWQAQVEALRTLAADTLFDGDVDGLALVPSAAYALATAARNLPLAAGDAVLVLDAQFPSNLLPWQQRCKDAGARIIVARRAPGQDWTEAVLAAIDAEPRIRTVTLPHARWHDGALLDLDRVSQAVHAADAALVLDLSQSLGVLPVDLARWRPDFIAAVGYKWLLGPMGLAYLWTSPRWRGEGIAIEQHWSARDPDEVWTFNHVNLPRHRTGARRFDAGGVADPLRVAMATAGIAQIKAWGIERIAARLGALTAALDAALHARGVGAWTTPQHAPHFMGLRPPASLLSAFDAALRAADILCSVRGKVLRVAPHLHVTPSQIERVAQIAAGVHNEP